ncbi:sensor histidine kinase [Cohnella faecalis]|uniref:histidine kinase n=2 Tax=Cohnella faecalis TaxID=2315694 RepID=A0A398CI12_9BACL|nr:sensor histidine kinase [Cohnella faecalis]
MKIQRRLAFQFTFQLIIYSVLIIAITLVFVIAFTEQLSKSEIKNNFPHGALDMMVTEAVTEDTLSLSDFWTRLIEERRMWLQVIDENGVVVYKVNVPASQPSSYSVAQLLTITDTERFGPYTVNSQLDDSSESPYLFLLGYENPKLEQLISWFDAYQSKGLVNDAAKDGLLEQLSASDGYLTIVNDHGEIVQTIGDPSLTPKAFKPLELLSMRQSPDNYDTGVIAYQPESAAITWILHTPNDTYRVSDIPELKDAIGVMIAIAGVALFLSLASSIWHGYRYGRPLLLFAGWFERMGQGMYDSALSPRERRIVFRRNGKLRVRFRLYKEVIQSFHSMAEKLAQTEKDRALLDKTREEWMTGISHDLRTPLSTIQGYGYILENKPDGWSPEELQEMGTMIREKGDYMLELIRDFSYVFQLKQASFPFERERIDIDELLRRSVLKYVNDATLAEAEFVYDGEERPVPVLGNAMWLQRLVDNLLSNAVNHNLPGVIVTVSSGLIGGEAYIKVSDNGRGMDEETKRNLFERYYRGTNTEESTVGSGLGMSIAKMIAEAHQGRIEVRSSVGSGTEIAVFFALAAKE